MASDRADTKTSNRLTVSNFSFYTSGLQALTSEYLVARELGLLFDPQHYAGRGDGHKRDLWRGPVTASLKTRGSHLPGDFLFVPGQEPDEFPDDYGIVGRWCGPDWHPYRSLEIIGYFSYFDWVEDHEIITLPSRSLKPGDSGVRTGFREGNLRPIEELIYDLERVPDEKIRAIQNYGYKRYFGDWYRSGRYPVL